MSYVKTGDLAIVVASKIPENIGATCVVGARWF